MRGRQVAVVDEFVYLGALTHSSVLSSYDIHRRSGLTRSAMQKYCIWKSRLSLSTKLKLYKVCILPIMLYGSECWALSRVDARKVDALDQWCLMRIFNIYAGTTAFLTAPNRTTSSYYDHTEKKTHAVWSSGQNGRVSRRQENSDCSSPK